MCPKHCRSSEKSLKTRQALEGSKPLACKTWLGHSLCLTTLAYSLWQILPQTFPAVQESVMFVSLLEAQPTNHHYHSHKCAQKMHALIDDGVVVRKATKETHNWNMRRQCVPGRLFFPRPPWGLGSRLLQYKAAHHLQ